MKYDHKPMIVLTGGPGAGKTAVLEMLRKEVCPHVAILPEAAGILFGGGFWRLPTDSARAAAQRAIFRVQRELETIARTGFGIREVSDFELTFSKKDNSFH